MEVLGVDVVLSESESTDSEEQKIDLILTDYCMPEMTGYDLLKVVKENTNSRNLPVVIMSSENDPQRISRCLDIGAEDFIIKPLQVKDAQRLRDYAKPVGQILKPGTKRKLPADLIGDGGSSEARPRLVGKVGVA